MSKGHHKGLTSESERADPSAFWSRALAERLTQFNKSRGTPGEGRALGELWTLLSSTLQLTVRLQARKLGPLQPEDVEDIASEKAIAILSRFLDDQVRVDLGKPEVVARWTLTIARNGVIDHLRRTNTRSQEPLKSLELISYEKTSHRSGTGFTESADASTFARALVNCVSGLTETQRTAWFLRVFYDMSSADIARHPDVAATPGSVNVMLSRVRRKVSNCMRRKGLFGSELPAGTFARLWALVRKSSFTSEEA